MGIAGLALTPTAVVVDDDDDDDVGDDACMGDDEGANKL